MSQIRRYPSDGHPIFVTSVTYRRLEILREFGYLLQDAFVELQARNLYNLSAWVILPSHFHAIIELRDRPLPSVVQSIKQSFSMKYRLSTGATGRVWQSRYWDHIIRDEHDLKRHLDYIHYNPVKHGLTNNPAQYAASSYRSFLANGMYTDGWGKVDPEIPGKFGE